MVFLEYNVSMSHDSEIPLLVNPEEFSHLCSRKTFILFVIAEKKNGKLERNKVYIKSKMGKEIIVHKIQK